MELWLRVSWVGTIWILLEWLDLSDFLKTPPNFEIFTQKNAGDDKEITLRT